MHVRFINLARTTVLAVTCFVVTIFAGTSISGGNANADSFDAFAEPVQTIHLSASEPGRIDDVGVKRGDHVQNDTIVMRLDSKVLEASREIARLEAESTTQIDSLNIEYEIKRNRHEQVLKLLGKGAVSREEARRSEADAKIAELNRDAAIEKQKLAALRLAEIDGRIEQRCVRGQVSGLVIDVLREPGEYVSTADPHVATVVVLDQLRCTFFVSTAVADLYRAGESVDVMMERTGASGERRVAGQVEYIAAVTQADSGRVRMDVLIENKDRQLRSGLRCRFDSRHTQVSNAPAFENGRLKR